MKKLLKNKKILLGVCSKLSEKTKISATMFRIIAIIAFLFWSSLWTLIAYIALAVIMRK